jgi:hypothetical protein
VIDLPSDMDGVIKRWYPAGVDEIASGRAADPVGVFVHGSSGAGVSTVDAQLDLWSVDGVDRAPDIESAAVVLFVLDASAPIGRTTLAALEPVLESTATGVLVNKVDAHRGWRDVVRSVTDSIAEFVPRAVDVAVMPTSALLAEKARAVQDPLTRTAMVEESGIRDVLDFVESAATQHTEVLRRRKYDAAVRHAAAGARQEIVRKARAVTSASNTAALRAERARLTDIRDRTRAERTAALRTGLQLARAESVHDVSEAVREFASSARESIDNAGRAELRHLQPEMTARLDAVASAVDARLSDRLRAIDTDLELSVELSSVTGSPLAHPEPSIRRGGVEDKMMIVLGASAGVGLSRLAVSPLSVVPALEIAVIPLSLVLGAFCAWWLVGSRKLVADRAHLRTWVADASAAARSTLEQRVLARILTAESAYSAAARETSRVAARAADTELERVEAELRVVSENRASVLAACDRDLAALDRGVERFTAGGRAEPETPPMRLNQ